MRYPIPALVLGALTIGAFARAETPGVLSLEDAISLALSHQPDMASAAGGTRTAEGALQTAESGLLPSVSLNASKSRQQDEPAGFQGASTSVSASQLVFDLGRTPHTVAAARAQLRAARASEEATRLQVTRNVTDAYFALLKARGVVAADEDSLASRQSERDASQARLDNGSAARFDVLRADTALAQSRQALVAARADVRKAEAALNTVIGRPANIPVTPSDPVAVEAPAEKDPVAYGLANRPDVLVARLQRDSARQSLSATRVGNAPTLSVGGELNGAARTFPADTLRWSAGLTLSWNVFDGFRNAGEIKSSQGAVQQAEATVQSTELAATQQVTDAVIALETAAEQVRLGETTVAQATEARDVAVGRYQAGAGSQLEVTDAESQLHTAIVDLSNARYDLAQAKRDMWFVLGRNA